jgi:hypothetical protein
MPLTKRVSGLFVLALPLDRARDIKILYDVDDNPDKEILSNAAGSGYLLISKHLLTDGRYQNVHQEAAYPRLLSYYWLWLGPQHWQYRSYWQC